MPGTRTFAIRYRIVGSNPGQLGQGAAVAVAQSGDVYVSDTTNNRIQVFEPAALNSRNKAIIVAGGGPYAGNNLWDATEMNANFAYRTLTYQGFTKDRIYYLSSDTRLDLDGNGAADDVDGDVTRASLMWAITTWAKDAEDVVVYLVDHGGTGGNGRYQATYQQFTATGTYSIAILAMDQSGNISTPKQTTITQTVARYQKTAEMRTDSNQTASPLLQFVLSREFDVFRVFSSPMA